MKNKKYKISFLIIFLIGLPCLQAQEAVVSTGGNSTGSGGSASYSVGQVIYTTNTGTTGSVSQGIQQAYEITVVNSIKETDGVQLSISTYPNPVKENLILKIEEEDLKDFSYLIYDISGRMLENSQLTSDETFIYMGNLVPGTYFLKVSKSNTEIKIFKIVKN